MSLSEKAKERYIRQGGVRCPYCYSYDLDPVGHTCVDNRVEYKVKCCECQREWTDVHTLAYIREDETVKGVSPDHVDVQGEP